MRREGEFRESGNLPKFSCTPLGGLCAGEVRENERRRGPSNAFSEGGWYPGTPLKHGASGNVIFKYLPFFLGRERMVERRIRKERRISRMSACKKLEVMGALQRSPTRIVLRVTHKQQPPGFGIICRLLLWITREGASVTCNVVVGRRCRRYRSVRDEGGFIGEKRSGTSLTNQD